MKPIERVSLTLQHKEPDRVPVYPLVNSIARKAIGASYADLAKNAEICAQAYIKTTEKLGLDVICTLTDLSVEAADFGQKIVYSENEAAHPDGAFRLVKDVEDYLKIQPVNPRITPRMSEHIKLCNLLVQSKGKDVPIVAFIFAPLGILSMLRGPERFFMDVIDCPDYIKSASEVITETLIEYCSALIETGVHAIMLDTLYASQSIMSKQMWNELEAPYVKRISDHIHKSGCMVMLHNCGKGVYFDAQIEAMRPQAISFLHIPDGCKTYADAKAKYGDITTLIGYVSPGWLMTAKPGEVEEECKKEIDTMKKGGGFILSTGCEYPASLSFENAEIMCRVAKEYGKY